MLKISCSRTLNTSDSWDLSPDLKIGVIEWHFQSMGMHCLAKLTEKDDAEVCTVL